MSNAHGFARRPARDDEQLEDVGRAIADFISNSDGVNLTDILHVFPTASLRAFAFAIWLLEDDAP
jgi:hypothetical protein